MPGIHIVIPHEKVVDFHSDLTAWSAHSGRDPQLTISPKIGETTNIASPVRYFVDVDESFFEDFPDWRLHIEQ